METKVKKYKSAEDMAKDKVKMQREGWTVVEAVSENGRYGCLTTLILGIIFLPIVLVGKKRDSWVVTYSRETSTKHSAGENDTPEETGVLKGNNKKYAIAFVVILIIILFFVVYFP